MNAIAEPPAATQVPQPGNMSERQLGQMLSNSTPPKKEDTAIIPPEKPPVAERIPATPETTGTETNPPADNLDSKTDQKKEQEQDHEQENAPENLALDPALDPDSPSPTDDEPPAPKTTLPPELADAIEIAKGDGKQGLAKVLVRLHKLVDQRDTERNARLASDERIAALELQVKEAKENAGAANAPVSLNGDVHPAVKEVTDKLTNVDEWLNWCDDNPDGGKVADGKGGEIDLDAAGVRTAKRGLERQRTELVARKVNVEASVKEAFSSAYTQQHGIALKMYPELFKKDSMEAQASAQLLQMVPALKQFPDYEVVIGRYIRGLKLELAQAKVATTNGAPKKPVPAREPTPVSTEAPGATAGSMERGAGDKEVQELEERYRKSGRTADFAKWSSAKARAQRAKVTR